MKKTIKQSDYWDTVLDTDNRSVDLSRPIDINEEIGFYYTPTQEYAYRQMGDLRDKKILEIGCGMGINSIILSNKGAKVFAIDLSIKRLMIVNDLLNSKDYQNIQLLQCNGEILPYRDNSFDILYTNAVLIHMDKWKALSEFQRVVKPGGLVILIEPLKYHPLVNLYRYFLGPKIWREIASYISFQDISILSSRFDNSTHKEFYFLSFLCFYWQFGRRNLGKFKTSLKRWYPIDVQILRIFPFLKRFSWFTVFVGIKSRY